jgi:hypothetical protein
MKSTDSLVLTNPDILSFQIIASGPRLQAHPVNVISRFRTFSYPAMPIVQAGVLTNGYPAEAWFEWGKTESFGRETPHHYFSGNEMYLLVSDSILGADQDSLYYCRFVARNEFGTTYGGIQPFRIGDLTGVESHPDRPAEFALLQNYPNPFNPSTVIHYRLPVAAFVNLKIYDVLGEETAQLENQMMMPGEHAVVWNAGDAPAGIYFCRLQAGSYLAIKKLVLIR